MKMKKILAVLAALVLLLSTAACSAKESNQGDSQTTGQAEQTTKAEAESVSAEDYGFFSMNPYDETLKLNDRQKTILKYFDDSFIEIGFTDTLARNPKKLRGMKVYMFVSIQKILESTDESFTIVGTESFGNGDVPENLATDYNHAVVIKGPQPDERFMVGDIMMFYGVFEDIEAYTIDSVSYQLPTIQVYDTNSITYEGDYPFIDELDDIAKMIFGDDVVTRDAKEGIDYEIDELHGYDPFKIIELSSSDSEIAFEMDPYGEKIIKRGSTKKDCVSVLPAADFEHFYFYTQNLSSGTGKIEYMTKDFKPVWSVAVEAVENEYESFDPVVFDYNCETFMYMLGSDLHIVDVSSGEEKVSPVYVGERIKLAIGGDGCAILCGKGSKDNFIKVDPDGKILWKASVPFEVESCDSIQVQTDSSAIIGFRDRNYTAYVTAFEPDGSFSEPSCVVYGSSDYYMSGD